MGEDDALFEERRAFTHRRLHEFREALAHQLGSEHEELIGDHTTVYVVGSGGRDELSTASDLDLFLVKSGVPRRMDEVRLQSAIIRALAETGFPRPSDDARFLRLHSAASLVQQMGAPEDDWLNTFTVRMLLLLESKPLLGEGVHRQVMDACLSAYWKNVPGHEARYLPIILVNDIIRYWRILLLNYEAKTEKEKVKLAPEDLESDRRLRTCKLRFSRCLMCYATIVDLLGEAHATLRDRGSSCVERAAVDAMVKRTPLDRLRSGLAKAHDLEAAQVSGRRLLALYALFLREIDRSKEDQLALLADVTRRGPLMRAATEFGDVMYALLGVLGAGNPLYRYVVL